MELGRFELCLNVADLAKSKEFYEKLGLRIIAGDEAAGFLVMLNDSVTIGLYQGHLPSNLISFRGGRADDLVEHFEEAGLPQHDPDSTQLGGTRGLWLKDPDGNLIYFNAK